MDFYVARTAKQMYRSSLDLVRFNNKLLPFFSFFFLNRKEQYISALYNIFTDIT